MFCTMTHSSPEICVGILKDFISLRASIFCIVSSFKIFGSQSMDVPEIYFNKDKID